MTTRAERVEDRERRRRMAELYPSCRWCKRPVVAGQTDIWGVPAHLSCALAFGLLPADHPAQRWTGPPETSTGTGSVENRKGETR